ncbi:MAG: hypothetical protein EAZ31_06050 [Cytophagia bacterium]|nr:MAG: hypothetical protein EAZ31_06050 [Cytophagia bacterium]
MILTKLKKLLGAFNLIGNGGTLLMLIICLVIDFVVPIGLYFLLRSSEDDEIKPEPSPISSLDDGKYNVSGNRV